MGQANFDVNSTFLFVIVGLIILFVLAQSVFFLIKAWRRGKKVGMDAGMLRRIASTAAVFTVAPAVAILLGVVTLSKKLGVPLPWLRLSVIGSITYELTAAEAGAKAVGTSIAESSVPLRPEQYTTIVWVMAIGIIIGLLLVPLLSKRILKGMNTLKNRDQKWGDILSTALFLGMISAFLGVIFATVNEGLVGWIPVFVMVVSAILMSICGLLVKRLRWGFMADYALPVSMLGGMALAIPITNLVTMLVG